MKLLRATVKNYRVIQDKTVDFNADPQGITAILGNNESGKSTFLEAIKACLFIPSSCGGDLITQMRSSIATPGIPEVEVTFLSDDGQIVTVHKLFAGNNKHSQTTLSGLPGGTLSGEDAETKLAGLLGDSEDKISGRGADTKFKGRFSNLFVKQGGSIEDPFSTLSGPVQDSLNTTLGKLGGALLISERDSEVQNAALEKYYEWYTAKGKVAANSPLDLAEKEVHACQERVDELQNTVSSITENKQKIDSAVAAIQKEDKLLDTLRTKQLDVENLKKSIHQIEQSKTPIEQARKDLNRDLNHIQEVKEEITSKTATLHKNNQELATKQAHLDTLITEEEKANKTLQTARAQYDEAANAEKANRAKLDRVSTALSTLDAQQKEAEAKQKASDIHDLEEKVREATEALEKLPPLSEKTLQELRRLNNTSEAQQAAYKALAASIRVDSSPIPVAIDGTPLSESQEILLDHDATITIGDTTLTLKLGGKEGIAGAKEKADQAAQDFALALANAQYTTLTDAEKAWGVIQNLQANQKSAEANLKKAKPDAVKRELEAAEKALRSATARLDSKGIPLPSKEDHSSLLSQKENLEALVSSLENDTAAKDAARYSAQHALDNIRSAKNQYSEAIGPLKGSISSQGKELELLHKKHGSDDAIATSISRLEADVSAKTDELAAINQKISDLDPTNSAEQTEKNLEKNILDAEARKKAAATIRDSGIGAIRTVTDGKDPIADLKLAEAALAEAQQEYARLQKTGHARTLLATTFSNVSSEIARDLNAPLLERITPYLKDIFGAGASVSLNELENETQTLRIRRNDGEPFTHDVLSGGAKEQLTVATLLATAEVLAQNHGGSLPILLDDAFVNSDADRLKGINRMLQRAAKNGLQPILFSCTDADFASIATLVRFG